MHNCVVLILAAGMGKRFSASGGAGEKLHAQLGDKTVLANIVAAVQASGLPYVIVKNTAEFMSDSMAQSIAYGVRQTLDAQGWLILPADLPMINSDTIRAVAAQLSKVMTEETRGKIAVRPVYAPTGQMAHPVGFSAACKADLLALAAQHHADEGAKSVLSTCHVLTVDTDDIGCIADIDTCQDLARAAQAIHLRQLHQLRQADT